MDLKLMASTSFVLVDAAWSPSEAIELIEALDPTHVVVARRDADPSPLYYLFEVEEARSRLQWNRGAPSVREALDLHEHQASPVLSADADPDAAPDRFVVHQDGRVSGFVDTTQPLGRRTRGVEGPGGGGGGVAYGGGGAGGADFPPAPAAESPAPPETVSRTMVAEFPRQVAKDETASLLVSLSSVAAAQAGIPVVLPKGSQLDVVVQARRGFLVEGLDQLPLTVSTEDDPLPIQFTLRAVEVGPGQVDVLAFHQGQALGRIRLSPMVVEPAAAPQLRGAAEPRTGSLAPVTVQTPDLSVLIEEWQVGEGYRYTVRLTAADRALGLNLMKFGPLDLRLDPGKFFSDFFADIESLSTATPEDRAEVGAKMASKGTWLFETVFPEDLRRRLWALKDNITSILIQSEEPWIPWELCKLSGETDGQIVDGPFLCEAYTISRWDPGTGFQEPITLNQIALVVPNDSGLAAAAAEGAYIASLAGNGRQVIRVPATPIEVRKALASGMYDCWHFTGHGAARDEDADRSRIILEGGRELTPEDVSGQVANLGKSRPLVFLNACQVGRAGMSLTGIGGWAKRFLDAGAGAFIGAYWSVYDQPAVDFAKAVYGGLLGGASVGKAVQDARAAIKATGDPTWLAYTVFADPMATVQA